MDRAPFTDPKFMTLVLMVVIVYLRDWCPFSGLFWYKGMLLFFFCLFIFGGVSFFLLFVCLFLSLVIPGKDGL